MREEKTVEWVKRREHSEAETHGGTVREVEGVEACQAREGQTQGA